MSSKVVCECGVRMAASYPGETDKYERRWNTEKQASLLALRALDLESVELALNPETKK